MRKVKAKWRLRQVAAVYALRFSSLFVLFHYVFPIRWSDSVVLVDLVDRLISLGLIYFTIKRAKQSFTDLGFTVKNGRKQILIGAASGFVLLSASYYSEQLYAAIFSLDNKEHPLVFLAKNADSWQNFAWPFILGAIIAPVTEELFYRLFTFLPLKQRFGFFPAMVITSLIFAVMHYNVYWLPEMLLVSGTLCWLYHRSGSLIAPITAHFIINSSKLLLLYQSTLFNSNR